MPTLKQELIAEFVGTAFLIGTIIGAGLMADTLSPDNVGVALIGNTLPIGAILYVLITALGPVSGAHFNPVVTLIAVIRREMKPTKAIIYVAVQIIAGVLSVLAVHAMFEADLFQVATKVRYGPAQWLSEIIATFGLLFTILVTVRVKPETVPTAVALYITAAIWFTSSTSFANPAVTIARALTDTFTGIEPAGVLPFIASQIIGAISALFVFRQLFDDTPTSAEG